MIDVTCMTLYIINVVTHAVIYALIMIHVSDILYDIVQ